jgi:hypothetical protein
MTTKIQFFEEMERLNIKGKKLSQKEFIQKYQKGPITQYQWTVEFKQYNAKNLQLRLNNEKI